MAISVKKNIVSKDYILQNFQARDMNKSLLFGFASTLISTNKITPKNE